MNAYCNRVPAWLVGFAGRFPGFAARYLTLDPRSLGLGRIYLGTMLMLDLLRRVPDLEVWYTNVGLLPNHTLLWRPGARYQFSFFFPFSWTSEVVVLFALCGVIFFCFLIGWKTRLFHWLSVLCIVSLHDRVIFLENGGDVVLNILAVWTLFLPMGARFSVDALLVSLQTRREANLAEVDDRGLLPRELRPALTLGVLGLLLQVSVIYYFNVVHKGGHTWRDGTAVHYALHQDRLVSWLGWKIRPHLTLPLSQVLTYSALVVESLGPLLVLNPFHWRLTRRLAVILMAGLHIGFALLLNLGLFSFNMIGFFLLLIPGTDWDRHPLVPPQAAGPGAHRAGRPVESAVFPDRPGAGAAGPGPCLAIHPGQRGAGAGGRGPRQWAALRGPGRVAPDLRLAAIRRAGGPAAADARPVGAAVPDVSLARAPAGGGGHGNGPAPGRCARSGRAPSRRRCAAGSPCKGCGCGNWRWSSWPSPWAARC